MNEIDQGNVEFYTYQCIKKSEIHIFLLQLL